MGVFYTAGSVGEAYEHIDFCSGIEKGGNRYRQITWLRCSQVNEHLTLVV